MAKRFTETTKWDDPWYQDLTPINKCLWQFILDKCDHAGIWVVNWRAAEFNIGAKPDPEKVINIFDNRIVLIEDGLKWFIRGFVNFQYGKLSEKCKAHVPVIKILQKYQLFERVSKGYPKGIDTLKEKEQDKEKEKEKEKGGMGGENSVFIFYDFDELKTELLRSEIWLQGVAMTFKVETDDVIDQLNQFLNEQFLKGNLHRELNEIKSHFINWYAITIKKNDTKNNYSTAKKSFTEAATEYIQGAGD